MLHEQFTKENEFIINSLLDIDFYKFPMGNIVFLKHADVQVEYDFISRTKSVNLAKLIDEKQLRKELDHVRTLHFNNSELHYLRGTNEYQERMFGEEYLTFLKNIQFPEYELKYCEDKISLKFKGEWSKSIYWETIALSIINELYFRSQIEKMSDIEKDNIYAIGINRLYEKIKTLKQYPGITFSDFGTRRRAERLWQEYVVRTIAKELPNQFVGTSNVKLAMDLGLYPSGTSAHEMDMIYSGIYHDSEESIRQSHNKFLQDWWEVYGYGLSIGLTDTYGTEFFFSDMTKEQATKWKGLRHDSGDPIIFGERVIEFYKNYGIDPKTKMIVFSDGLDIDTIIQIYEHFKDRIKVTFGWGTTLTNDLSIKTLSIVVKAVVANGHGLVKLSDNLNKALGNQEDISLFKEIFDYKNIQTKELFV